MLNNGSIAPDFTLLDQDNKEITLSKKLINNDVILYFYPSDFTYGCTKEACSFRDLNQNILDVGLEIIGISPQDPKTHAKFKNKYNLPFTLLCDPNRKVIDLFDAIAPTPLNVRRITYIINQEQKIVDSLCADLLIGRHKKFIQKAINSRKS